MRRPKRRTNRSRGNAMPVLNRVLSRLGFQRKAEVPIINDGRGNLPSIRVSVGGGLPGAVWTPFQYQDQARAGYQRNPDVYACISLIATTGKQVKWWNGEEGAKSLTPRELLAHKVLPADAFKDAAISDAAKLADPRASYALLLRAGGATFIENWLSYLLLSGNAYIEFDRVGTMLWLDRPDRVTLPAGIRSPRRGVPDEW